MRHPAIPPRVSWPWILGAAAVWLVMAIGGTPDVPTAQEGAFSGTVRLDTELHEGRYGSWAIGTSPSGRLLVEVEAEASRGDFIEVTGTISAEPGRAAGKAYGGVLTVRTLRGVTPSPFLAHRAGRWVRERVIRALRPYDDARALLAGFLIGDVSRISELDIEAMRRSGLAHFVAVSGSNVALFLALLAVTAGPLALGPRRRAAVGLASLPVYAAATGFEPSVMRASLMAGVALAGRLLGVVFEAWQLLSLAVAGLVVYDPALTSNVGFQLSVAATAGVLMGARWPARGIVARALLVTLGAQLAVAPLIIVHFGSVPLLSPVVNLLAAPLVSGATVLGALGVAGLGFLLGPASWLAGMILGLARGAAGWPQLNAWPLIGVLAAALACWRLPRARPAVVVATALVAVMMVVSPGDTLPTDSVTVLDVGQGDAILIDGGGGHYALVDGGPDRGVLAERLRHYGVSDLDLVVVSHVHADHVTGLSGIVGRVPVDAIWAVTDPHTTPAFEELATVVALSGLELTHPSVGERRKIGDLVLRVEGPVRRYASPNDQSLVVSVIGRRRTMLLTGDIETFAQADLAGLTTDVLKVPHQGAATSDPEWLESVGAELAIISVGPNQFGHPVDWVIDLLEESGATVKRTDRDGDVTVELS
ncbi:MAG: ComEC/Rec2 family competence protein [Acidimicrobiia bacterium]